MPHSPHRMALLATTLVLLGCQQASSPVVPAATGNPAIAPSSAPSPSPTPVETPMANRTWLAFGDSITQDAFTTDLAWSATFGPGAPPFVNAGVRGDTTQDALARVDALLAAHPDAGAVGLAFGTNDVYGRVTVIQFRQRMQALVDKVKAAGAVPVVATIPYSPDAAMDTVGMYNAAIVALTESNDLPTGPDLYALVAAHEDYLRPDGIHMTAEGSQAIQRAWATIAVTLVR